MADERAIRSWISDEESVPVSLRQKGNAPLQLFRGPEEKINLVDFEDGRVFVSTDTRKIYLDAYVTNVDGQKESKRLSLGGSSGIFYGIHTFEELEATQAEQLGRYSFVYDVDSEYHGFDISAKEIPQANDLILNNDGCFYRVVDVIPNGEYTVYQETDEGTAATSVSVKWLVSTVKLTIAGSGGGGGGGYGSTLSIRRDPNHNGNIILADGRLEVGFMVTDLQPDSTRVQVDVIIRNRYTNMSVKRVPVNTGEVQYVDLYRYRNQLVVNEPNMVTIKVTNDYGATASYTYSDIRPIQISVQAVGSTTLAPVYTDTAVITVLPMGGSAMYRWDLYYDVHVPGYSEWDRIVDEWMDSALYDNNQSYQKSFALREIYGEYAIDVWMRAWPDRDDVDDYGNIKYIESEKITLKFLRLSGDTAAVSISTDANAYNQYQSAVISYQAIYQAGMDIACRITAKCNDEVVGTLQPTIPSGSVRNWTLNLRKAGTYVFTIEAIEFDGVIASTAPIVVTASQESIPVINENDDSLQIYYTAEGKDNASSDYNIWENRGRAANINAQFYGFNWINNGWILDDDNVPCLHLTNGAKVVIPFAVFAHTNCGESADIAASDALGGMKYGKSIELDFKVNNLRDVNAKLIDIASWNGSQLVCGIVGTGEKISINTKEIKGYMSPEAEARADDSTIGAANPVRAYLLPGRRTHIAFCVQAAGSIPEPPLDSEGKPVGRREKSGLIYTYINGVASGLAGYSDNDRLADTQHIEGIDSTYSYLVFDSTGGDIDLYNIRVYNQYNSDTIVLNNYIADLPSVEQRLLVSKNNDVLSGGNVDLNKVAALGNIPYIVFTDCRKTADKKGTGGVQTGTPAQLPIDKYDFRWAPAYYVDPEDEHHMEDADYIPRSFGDAQNLVETVIYAQGTSSLQYPVKNLRMRIRSGDQAYSLRPSIPPADEEDTTWEHVPPVQLFTFKTDYMDSSMSHNTGIANMLNALYADSRLTTPAQQYYPNDTLVTAIVGRPVIAFYKPYGSDSAEFIGRYNFDLDKGEHVPFGFVPSFNDKYGILTSNMYYDFNDAEYKNRLHYDGDPVPGFQATTCESKDWIKKNYAEKVFYTQPILDNTCLWTGNGSDSGTALENHAKVGPLYEYHQGTTKDYVSTIQCWEFLNNASTLCRFSDPWDEATDLSYAVEKNGEQIVVDNEGNPVYKRDDQGNLIIDKYMPTWTSSFESRYPEYEEEQASDKRGFARLVNWIASTNQNKATNETLGAPVTYGQNTYYIDSREYRLAKFVHEFDQYMIKDFVLFYYILTEALLLVDSRSKNMMMCSYDVNMNNNAGHWFPIFYDMDTALAVDNNGLLKFSYAVDDALDTSAYNGQANYGQWVETSSGRVFQENNGYNVLWCNVREGFATEIAAMYRNMRAKGHFNVAAFLEMLNDQQSNAFAEIYDNKDAWYKYVRPLTTSTYITPAGKKKPEPLYGIDWTKACQGTRALHREQLLSKRFALLDGKYGLIKMSEDKAIQLRCVGIDTTSVPSDPEARKKVLYTPDIIPYEIKRNPDGSYKRLSDDPALLYDPENYDYVLDDNNERIPLAEPRMHTRQFLITSSSTQYATTQIGNGTSTALGNSVTVIDKVYAETPTWTTPSSVSTIQRYSDTETYVHTPGDIYDIGDLSDKFTDFVKFNAQCNLRYLRVGHPDPAYLSKTGFYIQGLGNAPRLEELNIQNMRMSNDTLNLASCMYFKKLYARGSTLQNVNFPVGGNIVYLELPATLTNFTLINNRDFNNTDTPENFILEGVNALTEVKVEGCPKFNTQEFMSRIMAQDAFVTMAGTENQPDRPQLSVIRLPDIGAFSDDDTVGWVFDPINHPEDFVWADGVITDIKLIKYIAQCLLHDPWHELFHGTVNLSLTNNRNFGGKIIILNGTNADENHVGIDILQLQRYYNDAFPNLRFVYSDNEYNVQGYSIKIHTSARTDAWTNDSIILSGSEVTALDFEAYMNGVARPVHEESSTDYFRFVGWSTVGYLEQADYVEGYEDVLEQYITYPYNSTDQVIDVGEQTSLSIADFGAARTIDIFPIWVKSRRTFTATFWGKPRADLTVDDEPIDVQQVPYLSYATVPEDVPVNIVLNPDDVADTQIGLLVEYVRDDSEHSFQILANTNFYPVFAPLQQAANITNPPTDYFTASPVPRIELENGTLTPADGVCATINASCTAKAVVVPLTLDGNPVITIKNESPYVERIYFEKDREQDGTSNILFFGNDDIGFAIPDPDQSYMYLPNSTLHYIDFGACQKLINIGLNGAANTFARCVNLEVRSLPDSLMYIGGHAFKQCTSITNITISPDLLAIDNFAFYYCTGLTSLDLSTPISRDASTLATALNGGLGGNYANYYPRIGQSAFEGCSNLQLSDNAAKGTWRFVSIGQSAFQNCTSLQCFNSSEAAANSGSLLYLGNQVFMNDRNLGLTNLPNNLIYIGAQAFMLSDSLTKVGIAITGLPQRLRGIGSSAFANTYISTDLNGYNLQWTLGDNEYYPDQMAEDAFANFWIRRLFITLSETARYVSINDNGLYQTPVDFQGLAPWQACKMDVDNNVITKYYTMAEMDADPSLRFKLWKYSNNPGD